MITKKFDYIPLSKTTIEGKRHYLAPDNSKLASVTTILDFTKAEESKKALHEWRQRVGVVKAQEITIESSGRGVRLHKWLEDYIKTDIIGDPGTNPYSIQSHLMAHTVINKGLVNCSEFWGNEVSLYFPKIYAGTTDCTGVHLSEESIIDFKQTNKLKKREWIADYFTQLVAYAECHNEVYNTKIRKGVIMMCCAAEGHEYQEFILEGNEFDTYKDLWWKRVEQYYLKH